MTRDNLSVRMRIISDAYSPGNWFMFPQNFLDIMDLEEAVTLSYLQNVAYKVRAEECSDGWFYCRMDKMMKDLRISRNTQTRRIGKLKKRKFISTQMRGMPPRRYILINWDFIVRKLENPKVTADEDL